MAHSTFTVGDLTAVIGDNDIAPAGEHRAGYNGVWSLRHSAGKRSVFVPAVAGLNYEHIVNGEEPPDSKTFFEPRNARMAFKELSDSEGELHQPPTPTYHVESWTRFKLVAPHYLDMSFRCVAHQHVFPRGYMALFWASYMNAPLDKSMTIVGDEGILFVANLRDDLGEVWHIPRDLRGSYARLRNLLEKMRHALGVFIPKELLEWLKYDGRRRIPLVGKCDPVPGNPEHKRADFLRGPAELAASVREKRPCRLPAELGVHMVEIINALQFPKGGGMKMKTKL